MKRAFVEQAERALRRYKGDLSETAVDPFFTGVTSTTSAPHSGQTVSKSLEEAAAEFMRDPSRARSEKTRLAYSAAIKLMHDFFGPNRRVSEIGREDCKRFRDLVISLPPNFRKRFSSANEAAIACKKRGIPTLHRKTVNSYLTHLSAFLGWAEREGYVSKNYAKKLTLPATKKSTRQPFRIDELQILFGGPVHRSREEGPLFWLPLLSLYTGARLNELSSLDVSDIEQKDGITIVKIQPGPDKRLKTQAAARIVPLHPELIRLGFVSYAQDRRRAGRKRVFSINEASDGYRSSAFSKRFARYLKELGLKRPEIVFHSLRHNFKDAADEAGIPRHILKSLGGWSGGGGGADQLYGNVVSVKTLHKHLRKLSYRGLVLDHLYP